MRMGDRRHGQHRRFGPKGVEDQDPINAKRGTGAQKYPRFPSVFPVYPPHSHPSNQNPIKNLKRLPFQRSEDAPLASTGCHKEVTADCLALRPPPLFLSLRPCFEGKQVSADPSEQKVLVVVLWRSICCWHRKGELIHAIVAECQRACTRFISIERDPHMRERRILRNIHGRNSKKYARKSLHHKLIAGSVRPKIFCDVSGFNPQIVASA